MGLLDKVKNLFTEEYEEEVPIKKEVKHVEITPPRRESVKEEVSQPTQANPNIENEVISDSTALNREERFKFPVYFDDKDFEDLPKKEIVKKEEVKKPEVKVEPYKAAKMIEEKKNFKPSPIISPVYGILDKNYKKEDIQAKKETHTRVYHKEEPLTVDDVRKKAFGTLEDELENTLISDDAVVFNQEPNENEIDIFKELEERDLKNSNEITTEVKEETVDLSRELERQKQRIDEINAYIKENSVKKEETVNNTINNEETKEEEIFQKVEEPALKEKEELENGDLFDLIDSMYEKRDEE